jgi:hypothetical protein
MKFKPLNLYFHLSQTTTINGSSSGWDIGYTGPKGLFIHTSRLAISKDAMAFNLKKAYTVSCSKGILFSVIMRGIALLDVLLFILILPIQLLVYILSFITSLLACIGLIPTLPWTFNMCLKNKQTGLVFTNRALCLTLAVWFACSIISVIYLIIYTILIPIEILFPEVCIYILKFNRWGTTQFAYLT